MCFHGHAHTSGQISLASLVVGGLPVIEMGFNIEQRLQGLFGVLGIYSGLSISQASASALLVCVAFDTQT